MGKVLVCGRGGSGKSTITAMLARYMAAQGRSVCVVDTDESNRGLHRMLGLREPKMTLAGEFGGRTALKKWLYGSSSVNDSPLPDKLHVQELPLGCISRRDNLALVSVGKIEEPHEGCACPLGALGKKLLGSLENGNWQYLVDAEAGVEHVGRGLFESCDAFLLVMEPSWESFRLKDVFRGYAAEFGKEMACVLNRAADNITAMMEEHFEGDPETAATLPEMPEVTRANLLGKPVPVPAYLLDRLETVTGLLFPQLCGRKRG